MIAFALLGVIAFSLAIAGGAALLVEDLTRPASNASALTFIGALIACLLAGFAVVL